MDKPKTIIFAAGGVAVMLLPVFALLDLKLAALGLAAAAALGLAAWQAGKGRGVAPPWAWLAGLAAFLSANLLAWAVSPYAAGATMQVASQLAWMAVAAAAAAWPPDKTERRWIVRLWVAGAVAVAAYALLQRAGVDFIPAYRQAASAQRAMSTFGNPTFLAAFLCFAWPLCLAASSHLSRPWPALALLVIAAGVVSTGSRAGLMAVAFQSALLAAWWMRAWKAEARARQRGLALACAALLLGAGLAWLSLPYGFWARPTLRLPLWEASLDLWLQRPWLGWGPGSFVLAFSQHLPAGLSRAFSATNQYAEHPHNFVLDLACESGLLGLTAFAWLAARAFKQGWPGGAVWPAPQAVPETARWRLALCLGLAGLLFQNLFDRNLKLAGSAFFLWTALGWLAGSEPSALPGRPPARVGAGKFALGVGLAVAACLLAWLAAAPTLAFIRLKAEPDFLEQGKNQAGQEASGLRDYLASHSMDAGAWQRLGGDLAKSGDFIAAAQAYEGALRADPSAAGAALNLGNCLFQLSRLPEAEQAYRKALILEPGSVDAHFDLGYVLYYQRRLKEAVAEFDEVLRRDPGHAKALKMKERILR